MILLSIKYYLIDSVSKQRGDIFFDCFLFVEWSDGWLQRNNLCIWSHGLWENLYVKVRELSMVGGSGNPGVMPRCLNDVFEKVEVLKKSKDVRIKISYMEIYNENLKDLLISEGREGVI